MWSLSWWERRYKRNEDHRRERDEGPISSGEGSSQTYQLASDVFEQKQCDKRDQELERLCRMVRDLELEVQGRRQRRDRDKLPEGSVSVTGSRGEASCRFGSHRSRDRDSTSSERRRPRNAVMDAMSRALCRAT